MNKLFLSLVVLFSGLIANAQDSKSEFFYQAGAGESFVQGNINYVSQSRDLTAGGYYDVTDMLLNVGYEMGLNEQVAVYGNLGYGTGEFGEVDVKGLNPINLGAKYNMEVGPGRFFGRANLGLGLLEDSDCNTTDCNRTDGAIDVTVRLGYLMSYETGFAGLAYDIGLFSTDGKSDAGDFGKKGGHVITAFYEHIMSNHILGGALSYTRKGFISNQDTLFFSEVGDMDANFMNLKVYSRMAVSEKLTALASLGYDFTIDHSNDAFDDGNGFALNLGVRHQF